MKECTDCKQTLPLSKFYIYDGRPKSYCKSCSQLRSVAWREANQKKTAEISCRSRLKHLEARRGADRQRRQKYKIDPVFLEEARQRSREWREANREKHRAYSREYGRQHPDETRQRRREWIAKPKNRQKQRERLRIEKRKRRLDRNSDAFIYSEIVRRDPCAYCGERGGVVDHIVSLSTGGANRWDNLTGACLRCNSSKRSKDLVGFLHARMAPVEAQ